MEWDLKMLVMFLHFIGVVLLCAAILFCEDIHLLIILVIIQLGVFAQILVLDGCLVAKVEKMVGNSEHNLTELIKSALYISNDGSTSDMEKTIVGMLLFITILKLSFLALPAPFIQRTRYLFLTPEGLQRLYYSYFSQSRYHVSA
jgi:hypothetical protein